MARITPNLLNQNTSRTVPGTVDVMGIALGTNTVTVDGQVPYRKGEYFRKELSLDNSLAAVWKPVTVVAPGEPSITRNEFVAKTNEFFYHDLDGNLTSDGRWAYTWDAENRLIRMVANSGVGPQIRIDFEYDWMSRRIAKKVWDNPAGTGSPTNSLKFVYDGWNLIAVLGPQSTVLRSFTWGLDLSGSLQGAGGVGGLLAVSFPGTQGAQTTNCFVAFDGNGNVSGLVNAADGKQLAQYEYGPFGEVIRATGPMAKANPFRFSTKYQDDETDLLYYGYRYYNASNGRWTGRDPLEEQAGYNLYALLDNDPLSFVDILGLRECQPVVRWNVRYDFDSEKLPKPPIPGIYVDGRFRLEVQFTRQDCKVCCPRVREGWESDVRIRGFARAGVTVTAGLKGNYSLGDNWGVDYWAGIRGEFAGQGEGAVRFKQSDCKNGKGADVCFGVRLFGRISVGGQGRIKAGRWGVATVELTGNGEALT